MTLIIVKSAELLPALVNRTDPEMENEYRLKEEKVPSGAAS